MRSQASIATGYPHQRSRSGPSVQRTWAAGGEPPDLPRVDAAAGKSNPRDVFVFVISGAKERAPAAARELLSRVERLPSVDRPPRRRRTILIRDPAP
jgi:hypothetical protein